MNKSKIEVGIIMGSDSDLPVMEDAVKVLKEFGVGYEVKVLSAHRTPNQHAEYSKSAVEQRIKSNYSCSWWCSSPPRSNCCTNNFTCHWCSY